LAPEVEGVQLNPLIVQARDTTGQYLVRAGSINESPAQVPFYEKQLAHLQQQKTWSEALEKQLEDEQRAFEQQHRAAITRSTSTAPSTPWKSACSISHRRP
jgi:hypothetical protein